MAQKVWFFTSGKAFRENCAEDDQVNLKSTLKKEQQKSVLFCFLFFEKDCPGWKVIYQDWAIRNIY